MAEGGGYKQWLLTSVLREIGEMLLFEPVLLSILRNKEMKRRKCGVLWVAARVKNYMFCFKFALLSFCIDVILFTVSVTMMSFH